MRFKKIFLFEFVLMKITVSNQPEHFTTDVSSRATPLQPRTLQHRSHFLYKIPNLFYFNKNFHASFYIGAYER